MAFPLRAEGNGLTSADAVTGPTLFIVTSFIALASYNVLELSVFIYTTFKRRRGLYFWSMVIATWGIALNGSGYLIKFIRPDESPAIRAFSTVLILLGWCFMITGHSVVLFSRLHLLVSDHFKIRLVLTMIVVDALICHPPTFALFALVQSDNPQPYAAAYSVYEKFQLLIFFIQEVIISIIYIMESARFLRARATITRTPSLDMKTMNTDSRTVLRWLIAVNVLVVLLDFSILGFEFSGFYDLQTSWVSAPFIGVLRLMNFKELVHLIKGVITILTFIEMPRVQHQTKAGVRHLEQADCGGQGPQSRPIQQRRNTVGHYQRQQGSHHPVGGPA